jgi:hypothetical protein
LLPTPVDTIDVSDIEANTLVLGHTGTEDIVTKYVVTWQKDYSQEPNKLILRHNVSKYGTQEQSYEFYCFAHLELVQKSATFWLIRKANTWRRVRFKTPLTKLALETFDAISLDVEHISDDPITCIVEAAEYDSGSNTLSFEVWTPVKAGSRVPYDFAYPAEVSVDLIFPTNSERDAGFAGSGRGPSFSVIAPKKHPLSFGGLVNVSFHSDFGESRPSDLDDQAPGVEVLLNQNGHLSTGTNPVTERGVQDCTAKCQQALEASQRALEQAERALRAAAELSNTGTIEPT